MFGLATRVLCVSVGYLFPAYKCFKLLRRGPEAIGAATDADAQRDVVKGILKHWIVMSGFTAIELVADTFLFWLPLVGLVKIAFVVWLVLPGINGAGVIYDYGIEPYLVRNEDSLDKYFQRARAAAHRSTEKVSMSAYDKWVGYMQRAVGEHTASTPSESPVSAESSGLSGLLKTVSQKMPQPSAAANYLAGISGIASGAQTAHPEPAAGSSYASVLTSWITSFSAGSSAGTSDQQRLEDIKSRKLQLQSLVSQLETSERTILERNLPQKAPDTSEPTATAHTEASEFEDDAVMVGEPCAGSSTESRASSGSADGAKKPDRKSQPAASTPSRRWFW